MEPDIKIGPKTDEQHWQEEQACRAEYAKHLELLQHVGWTCGYAIAAHGSMKQELDLIAVPWIERHANPYFLAGEIARSLNAYVHPEVADKPCGRLAFMIYWKEKFHINLSVVPDPSRGIVQAPAYHRVKKRFSI